LVEREKHICFAFH